MKIPKLPYKNCASDHGLKKKKEQKLFFEIINKSYKKVFGEKWTEEEYYKMLKTIHTTLFALIQENLFSMIAHTIVRYSQKKNKKHPKANGGE